MNTRITSKAQMPATRQFRRLAFTCMPAVAAGAEICPSFTASSTLDGGMGVSGGCRFFDLRLIAFARSHYIARFSEGSQLRTKGDIVPRES
jgi:hypothetical protein